MRIGIDARWIIQESSGIGQYTLNLVRQLAKDDSKNQYFLFFCQKQLLDRVWQDLHLSDKKNFSSVFFPHSVFSLKSQILLPLKLRKLRIDIFHSTNFMIPLLAFKTKMIVTIHDLIPFLFPNFAPKSKKSRFYLVYRILMKLIVRRANHIFVDSLNSCEDMKQYFPDVRKKIGVLTFGVDISFQQSKTFLGDEEIKKRYGKGPIILYVGRRDPYKNILGLIDIFHRLLNYSSEACLVLAGPNDSRYPEIQERTKELGLDENGKVIMTGYLSQEDLVRLYHQASVLVLPSFYEGFGLPILEAFSCGVPVVASRVASIPELVQDAGILLDPKETEMWVKAIDQLIKNQSLRQTLVEKGYERLKSFSWQRAVTELVHRYEETS